MDLCFEMHLASSVSHMIFDEKHMQQVADNLSSDIKTKVCLLLLYKDKPVGFLAGAASDNYLYPASKFAYEIVFYVQKEHRKLHSWALVDAFEQWAKLCGCHYTTLSHPCVPQLNAAYQERGYKPVEQVHNKELI
jgi:GNAT superfamily N-acetyltransferase